MSPNPGRIVRKAIAEVMPKGYTITHGKLDQVGDLGVEVQMELFKRGQVWWMFCLSRNNLQDFRIRNKKEA